MAQIITTTFIPRDADGFDITSYPAAVVDVEGNVIGEAADKHDYVAMWNSSATNKRVGKLYLYDQDLRFRLVSRYFGGCCRVAPKFDCGGASGGGTTMGVTFHTVPLDVSIDPPTTSFTPTANLRGKTILWVSRSGMKDMMPVSGAPANDVEIQFDATTNTFTVHPDWPLNPGESFAILYR
jgi:hypothetical protein